MPRKENPASEIVPFALSKAEKDALDMLVKALGVSRSSLLRGLLVAHLATVAAAPN